jgi:hypothetical protein
MKQNQCLIDWLALDIRAIPLCSSYFDTILEKGTLDVCFVGHEHHLWNPSKELKEEIDLILKQMIQCLRSGYGRFISFSFRFYNSVKNKTYNSHNIETIRQI